MKKISVRKSLLALATLAFGGLALSSHASVETYDGGSAVLGESVGEIRGTRLRDLNFDRDLNQLQSMENRYRRSAPLRESSVVRLPLRRILDSKEPRRRR